MPVQRHRTRHRRHREEAISDLLRDIGDRRVAELAKLLRMPEWHQGTPRDSWLEYQRDRIERHVHAGLKRTASGGDGSGWGEDLCWGHEDLDEGLIGWCCSLLKNEVGVHGERLRGYLRMGKNGGMGIGREVESHVWKLIGIGGLWLSTREKEEECCRGLGCPSEPEGRFDAARFERIESGCPACVLATVGGSEALLVTLKANILARAGNRLPRLSRLVDAWIDRLEPERRVMVWLDSADLGVKLRKIRKCAGAGWCRRTIDCDATCPSLSGSLTMVVLGRCDSDWGDGPGIAGGGTAACEQTESEEDDVDDGDFAASYDRYVDRDSSLTPSPLKIKKGPRPADASIAPAGLSAVGWENVSPEENICGFFGGLTITGSELSSSLSRDGEAKGRERGRGYSSSSASVTSGEQEILQDMEWRRPQPSTRCREEFESDVVGALLTDRDMETGNTTRGDTELEEFAGL